LNIKIFYDKINYRLRKKREVVKVIERVSRSYNRKTGDLSFIFTDDKEIKKINKEFLGRDKKTDVIAFDYDNRDTLNGEVYISVDTVKMNANNYKVSLRCELIRVMIHGTLHLCGLNDRSNKERTLMRREEDRLLRLIYKKI